MTNTNTPFEIGQLTTQGVFLGMQGTLAKFQKGSMLCMISPLVAKAITQEELDASLASQEACRSAGFLANATILPALESVRAVAWQR
jgi:hypothetical protein